MTIELNKAFILKFLVVSILTFSAFIAGFILGDDTPLNVSFLLYILGGLLLMMVAIIAYGYGYTDGEVKGTLGSWDKISTMYNYAVDNLQKVVESQNKCIK